MDVKFLYGIFLGARAQTDECIIGAAEGVVRARSIKRLPGAERWRAEEVLSIKGTPWAPGGDEVEQAIPVRIDRPIEQLPADQIPPQPEMAITARRTYLRKCDFLKHGYSEQCPGCRSIRMGFGKANHTSMQAAHADCYEYD